MSSGVLRETLRRLLARESDSLSYPVGDEEHCQANPHRNSHTKRGDVGGHQAFKLQRAPSIRGFVTTRSVKKTVPPHLRPKRPTLALRAPLNPDVYDRHHLIAPQ